MKQRAAILLLILACFLLMAAVQITKPYISRYFCVGCGDCVKHCPVSAITLVSEKAVIDTDKCINCGLCSKTCNYIAVRKPQAGQEQP